MDNHTTDEKPAVTGTKTLHLEALNRAEALRYLGYHGNAADETVLELMDQCEKELLEAAAPRFVYHVFDIEACEEGIRLCQTELVLKGNSIRKHLEFCEKAVVMAVTVSGSVDRLLRISQLKGMAKTVVLDSMASVCVEQACDQAEAYLRSEWGEYHQTWRFGIGYGDFSIEYQPVILSLLQAQKRIGLTANDSCLLNPTKSVTAVIGLSKQPLPSARRGCQTCNLRNTCQFRQGGGRCSG